MKKQEFSHLSLLTLMAVCHLGGYASITNVQSFLFGRTGQLHHADAVRQILYRMNYAGMLTRKRESAAQANRHPGPPQSLFRLTPAGRKLLKEHLKVWRAFADGLRL